MRGLLWPLLVTAAAYYVTGRLGLLLAIPPGYATAVWPASGIALAAILLWGYGVWPGILLGSFLVNVATTFDDSSAQTVTRSLAVASAIGGGAALQAVAGGWLIRRTGGFRNVFDEGIGAVRMLAIGGPGGCVINATVSVTTLWLAGLIPGENYLFNWFTWWVGDSIGVLIFTTLIMVWSLTPWQQWHRRQISVTLPMVLMFTAVVALFFFVSQREDARIHAEFEEWTQRFEHELEKDVSIYRNMLAALTGLYASSEEVTAREFDNFSRRLLAHSPEVLALSWNPRIPAASRAEYERAQRAAGHQGYKVYALDPAGRRVPPAGSLDHYPVQYIAPLEHNRLAPGYDAASEAVRRAAIHRAIGSGQPSASGPVSLVQASGRAGLLILAPVFTAQNQPRGIGVLVIDLSKVMRAAAATVANTGLEVRLHDVTDGKPVLMYANKADARHGADKGGFSRQSLLEVAGRKWRLDFHVSGDYMVAHRSWQAWSLLATGLLFTALLGIFLLVVIGHAARVEAVVRERTARLKTMNQELLDQVAERTRLQRQADLRSQQVSDKNRELERFAYVVSHDLQAPLRSLSGFAELLRDRFAAQLGDEGREFIAFITQGAAQMHRMIRDILAVSRVATLEVHPKPVDVGAVVQRALGTLRADIDAARARVRVAPMPVLQADEAQILQLFQNLIDNAIKFRVPGRDPEVGITATLVPDGWHFEVADNGVGIPADKVERLFNLFSRLHREDEYPGSGIGLAICRRIVERHRGQIWITSEPGRGSIFHVVLPA